MRLTYVREGTSKKEALNLQERIREKEKKKGTFLRPAKVYSRKARTSRRKNRTIVNPSGVSVFKKVFPTRSNL